VKAGKIPTAVLVLVGLVVGGCGGGEIAGDGKLQVVASFYPLAEAARRVGGPCVRVLDLTPRGVEPHDLELSPDALEAIAAADLVVYIGSGFQPAIEEGLDEASGLALDALRGQPTLSTDDGAGVDPHIWLDPSRYADVAGSISEALVAAGAPPGCGIDARTDVFRDELALLDAQFATGLERCDDRVIVTSHAAFAYLARAYGLRQEAIAGIDPGSEPSARRLAELREVLVRQGVSTIFTEELVAPDVAEVLASEVGAGTAVLRTVETQPEAGDYASAMRENLRVLREALGCA
jgi:zinc transport system substrate-binding protein